MLYENYVKTDIVKDFIHYICELWDKEDHSVINENKSKRRYRKSNSDVSIYHNLHEAFNDYHWDGLGITENTDDLIKYGKLIKNSENDLNAFFNCIKVLSWGNVIIKSTVNSLISLCEDGNLKRYLNDYGAAMESNSTKEIMDLNKCYPSLFISDSGATKIACVISRRSIIYDDRVAAGLCLLIKKFLMAKGYSYIPEELLLVAGKRSSNSTNRDPSDRTFRFKKVCTGLDHALSNLKANWLLGYSAEILKDKIDISAFNQEALFFENGSEREHWLRLRVLESALFMLGHSVPFTALKGHKMKDI